MPPPDLLALGREVLGRAGLQRAAGRAARCVRGRVGATLSALVPALLQQDGFVHGGVLSYLADNALTYAGGSVLGKVLTSEFKINYLRPAIDAERLVAVATVVASGKSQAVCRCDVFLDRAGRRELCAAAQGTIRKVG
jgi:uncharacterized protein (TIGR00369 family)